MTCAMSPLLIESLAQVSYSSHFKRCPLYSFSCHYIYLLYLDATELGLDVSHLTTKSLKLLLLGLCGFSLDWIGLQTHVNEIIIKIYGTQWKGDNFLNKDVSFSYCRKCICGELSVEMEWEQNCIKLEVVVLVYSEYQIWVLSQ